MNNTTRAFMSLGVVLALLWGMFHFGIGPAAGFTCDRGSIDRMKIENPAGAAAYELAYNQLCTPNGAPIDQSDNRDVDNDNTDTANKPDPGEATVDVNDPFVKVKERYHWLNPYTVEQMVTWDANEKVSAASGGPYFAIHPDLWGKDLIDLNPTHDELAKEAKFRLAYSPASVASNGAMFGYWSYDQAVLDAKVASYLNDKDKWRADANMIANRWDQEVDKGIKKYKAKAGSWTATFFYVTDGVSYVRINKNVTRTSDFWVFEFQDGTIGRFACGLNQEYWKNATKNKAPTQKKIEQVKPISLPPVPHNQEGTPKKVIKKVSVCRKVGDGWKIVEDTTWQNGDKKVGDKACKPAPESPAPSEPPKPSEPPQPSTEPSDSPSPSPEPTTTQPAPKKPSEAPTAHPVATPRQTGRPNQPTTAPTAAYTPPAKPADPTTQPRQDPPPSDEGGTPTTNPVEG